MIILKAKMVRVPAAKPQLLSGLPVWTEAIVTCGVCLQGNDRRFHGADGRAWKVNSDGTMFQTLPASDYTVVKVLGPLPSGNLPLPDPSEPPSPLRLPQLEPYEFAEVRLGASKLLGVQCHDGRGHVLDGNLYEVGCRPEDYSIVGDRWKLEIKVTEGGPDDG